MKTIFTQLTICAAALLSLTTLSFAQTQTTEKAAPKAAVMATKKAPKAAKTTKAEVGMVSLNKATAKELESLPGIGPAIAERIVAYRTEQGKFSELSELMEVKGIGEKKLAQLRPHLTLD
ncbi:helix-hairpin-helix domain-containing protein [Armatimonas sp.]|uniref:ComEA family DNA-binding protein n=1 Tax=Armatimonas sp. TaxID=1872638 RepID=UPI00286BD7B0|nr:helix-hairpin-helix domain-containing protein [Armatimonas sp.]